MKRTLFPWFYLGLGFAQTAHSVEEVLTGLWLNMDPISGRLHSQFSLIPHLSMPASTFAAANLIIVALLMGLSSFVFLKQDWACKAARIVAVIETLNGIGHITAALVTGAYFSGCLSGIALIVFSLPLWAFPEMRRYPHDTD